MSRIFTLSITFTATGTHRSDAAALSGFPDPARGGFVLAAAGTRCHALYTLPVRPTPSCLAKTYASSGEGARALDAATDAAASASSVLFRNSSSDMPIAVAVAAYEETAAEPTARGVADVSSDALEEERDDDPAADPAFSFVREARNASPAGDSSTLTTGEAASSSDRDRDAMSITERATRRPAEPPPSFLGKPLFFFPTPGSATTREGFSFSARAPERPFPAGESPASRASRMSSMVPTRVIFGALPPGGGVAPGDRAGTEAKPSRASEPFELFSASGAALGDANECNSPTTSSVTSATVVAERADPVDARTDPRVSAPPLRSASPSATRAFSFATEDASTDEDASLEPSAARRAPPFSAEALFCFLEGTPIARLIVLESVRKKDRRGDFARVSASGTALAGTRVSAAGLDAPTRDLARSSAGVGGICGFAYGVIVTLAASCCAVSRSGRLERLGTRAPESVESVEPRPSRETRRVSNVAPEVADGTSGLNTPTFAPAPSCLLRRWASNSGPQSVRSVARVISSVTGWYDDDATYVVDASRRSARPAAFSSSAMSARAASDKSQSSPKDSPAFSTARAPSAVTRSTSPSKMTCIARPRPSDADEAKSERFARSAFAAPGPAKGSPGLLAALADHSALSRSSLDSGGAGRKVSTTFSTFASNRRARWIRARTMRLNVSPETAKARVATPSRSPFSETTRALVRYACCSAASPYNAPLVRTFPGTRVLPRLKNGSRCSAPSRMTYRLGTGEFSSNAVSPGAHRTSRNSPKISFLALGKTSDAYAGSAFIATSTACLVRSSRDATSIGLILVRSACFTFFEAKSFRCVS